MKKLLFSIAFLSSTLLSFADASAMPSAGGGFGALLGLFALAIIGFLIWWQIKIFRKWWNMLKDVAIIKDYILNKEKNVKRESNLLFLVATGRLAVAYQGALDMFVEKLIRIYAEDFNDSKQRDMDEYIRENLPKINRMGIQLPPHVCSGKDFILYMNAISGNNVKLTY